MQTKNLLSLSVLAVSGAALLSACGSQEEEIIYTNPAEQYCAETGGSYVIRSGKAGDVGVCILPDGTERDAWTYYNENNAS